MVHNEAEQIKVCLAYLIRSRWVEEVPAGTGAD